MTNEEAIKELKEDRALYESDIVKAGDGTPDGDLMLAIDMAVEALEKQMPKKPINDTLHWAICPTCGGSVSKKNVREYVVEEGTSYCEHCGQALDWSDFK